VPSDAISPFGKRRGRVASASSGRIFGTDRKKRHRCVTTCQWFDDAGADNRSARKHKQETTTAIAESSSLISKAVKRAREMRVVVCLRVNREGCEMLVILNKEGEKREIRLLESAGFIKTDITDRRGRLSLKNKPIR